MAVADDYSGPKITLPITLSQIQELIQYFKTGEV